jgi:hypothetical protein
MGGIGDYIKSPPKGVIACSSLAPLDCIVEDGEMTTVGPR